MSNQSSIEWTEATWNPLVGCTRVSEGCRNCYAEKMAKRLAAMARADIKKGRNQGKKGYYLDVLDKNGRWNGTINTIEDALAEPLHWKKPRRVFVNSMSDLFHEAVPDEFIHKVFAVMARCQQHTFQVLTKRPERMAEYLTYRNCPSMVQAAAFGMEMPNPKTRDEIGDWFMAHPLDWPLPNVWLGTSVEDHRVLDRIGHLRKCPAAVRWLSLEPLIGPLGDLDLTGISWVVVGGESGAGARPMHPDWARSIRDQCVAAGVPFFFKQWGAWAPNCLCDKPHPCKTVERPSPGPVGCMFRCGKKEAGRALDGRLWDEYPAQQLEPQPA